MKNLIIKKIFRKLNDDEIIPANAFHSLDNGESLSIIPLTDDCFIGYRVELILNINNDCSFWVCDSIEAF